MKEGEDGRNPPDQLYPIRLIQRAFHRLRHRRHSFRIQLGHRPEAKAASAALEYGGFGVFSRSEAQSPGVVEKDVWVHR